MMKSRVGAFQVTPPLVPHPLFGPYLRSRCHPWRKTKNPSARPAIRQRLPCLPVAEVSAKRAYRHRKGRTAFRTIRYCLPQRTASMTQPGSPRLRLALQTANFPRRERRPPSSPTSQPLFVLFDPPPGPSQTGRHLPITSTAMTISASPSFL